ncbi:zinc finger protein ZFP2-like [Uranotaenia lowii]|uniref:zinc finger protein ZFP2-like n=1 Tax=Uranotaenia lowii TaxID=190385 RepID=UPI00247B03DC|nr:zinc finger protein ZFP2-like [Uranotaenia lowii]
MDSDGGDVDIAAFCRICMKDQSGNDVVSIFPSQEQDSLAAIITDCTSLQIIKGDGLPGIVCSSCLTELHEVVNFIEKARQSDRWFRKLLNIPELEGFKEHDKFTEFEVEMIKVEERPTTKDEEDGFILSDDESELLTPFEQNDSSDEYFEKDNANESDNNFSSSSEEKPKRKVGRPRKLTGSKNQKTTPKLGNRIHRKRKHEVEEKQDVLDELEQETFELVEVRGKYLCCNCYKIFDTEEQRAEHAKATHKSGKQPLVRQYMCNICNKKYALPASLKTHRASAKATKHVYKCLKCEACFVDITKRREHAHNHPEVIETTFDENYIPELLAENVEKVCCAQMCGQKFSTMNELLEHASQAHKANKIQSELSSSDGRNVQCPVCYKRFHEVKGLRNHQQRVYQTKSHQCSICGQNFSKQLELQRHEREHLNERNFECGQCPKTFYTAMDLKHHIRRHTAERNFVCTICGRAYKQKTNLTTHMLVHEGRLPFECEVCHKGFRDKSKMVYHMRVHSGERPFQCRYCDTAFADSTNRTRHEMSHTGIKPYSCDYCHKSFITKRLKKEHESCHTGKKPYECELCPMSFSKSIQLQDHFNRDHVEVLEEMDDQDPEEILVEII